MRNFQAALHQIADQFGDPLGIGRGGQCPIHRPLEPRSGDQLHRPRYLADVFDRLSAFIKSFGFGHWSGVYSCQFSVVSFWA